jgi:hypothetical protein
MIDSIVLESVRKQLLERSKVGINKYGVTLDRTDLTIRLDLENTLKKDQVLYLNNVYSKQEY